MIELLTDNHFDKLLDLFDGARREIKIISPFLTLSMAEKLCETVEQKGISCSFITRFYLEDMIAKANSIDALGSDTYIASFGRNEGIPAVGRKHYQKAHMRLSGNAKQYIDKKLDQLKAVYGVVSDQSNIKQQSP